MSMNNHINGITEASSTVPADRLIIKGQSINYDFKGVFINIDKVFFTHNDGTEETAREWLKGLLKETLSEVEIVENTKTTIPKETIERIAKIMRGEE